MHKLVLLLSCASIMGHAQWLNHPSPGVPRTPDGKPNLSAPAPRMPDGKPDLFGLWMTNGGGYQFNITSDLKPEEIRPFAQAVYKQRAAAFAKDVPTARCLPGGPTIRALFGFFKIIPGPGMMIILYESLGMALPREVFMDGRELPKDPNPTWGGYSVGHWEGDTLVIESTGFNDKTWLDTGGHPHSEDLRVTERFDRRDFGHMRLRLTIEDLKTYTRPWTIPIEINLAPDTEMLESVCNENERDIRHVEGISQDPNLKMTSELLTRYAALYEEAPGKVFTVELVGDELILRRPGEKTGSPLVPVSETGFVVAGLGANIEFLRNAEGAVTQVVIYTVEGETKAARKQEPR